MNFEQMIETAKALIAVPWCCKELKEAAQVWLDSINTPGERAAAEAFVKEAEEDACTIDDVIGFFSSPGAAAHFGDEQVKAKLAGLKDKKAHGEKYCDCDACALAVKVFENKAIILR